MFKYYCPVEEAMIYLANMINEQSVARNAANLIESHADIANELRAVLRPSLELEKYLNTRLTLTSPRYDFFFHCDFTGDSVYHPMSTPAGLLLGVRQGGNGELPSLDEIAAQRKTLSKQERLKRFYGDLVSFGPNQNVEHLLDDEDTCEGKFTDYVKKMNTSTALKRKVLDMYHNFDAYVDELVELIRPVVSAIKEAEHIYRNSLLSYEKLLDGIDDICEHMHSAYGLILPPAQKYDIYPCVLLPMTVTVKDGGFGCAEICVGAALHEVTELLYTGQDIKRLTIMLKSIAEETRLEMLHYVCGRPAYANEIADAFGVSGPTVSYHMNKLTLTGFVKISLRSGKAFYEADTANINTFIELFKRYINSPILKKAP